LRARLPEPAKRFARGLRLLFTPAPAHAPEIPQDLLNECRFMSSRLVLVEVLPKQGRVAEVGVQYGYFAQHILTVAQPRELHLIDLDFSASDPAVKAAPNVVLHEAASHEVLARFEDASFDWIYIDADHSYAGVKRDIAAAAAKVKSGGYLVFNDFARIVRPGLGVFGVHQAVCEFIVAARWPVSHFCFDNEGLYDIALRKP